MYAIGPLPCGYQIVFAGQVTALELLAWIDDVRRCLASPPKDFGLLLDLRGLAPLSPGATRILAKGLQLCQQKGLLRTAVVVCSRATRLEYTRMAQESGIYQWERYLSAEDTPDWHGRSIAWISQRIDPEQA
jgi:hypothetical protein